MMQASLEQALARRQRYVTPGGALTHVSTYIGTNKMELLAQGKTAEQVALELADKPMAYLVEQAPDALVDPHFHEVDQFQLFIAGGGRIGTHKLEGVAVHYAGAHTPYGPIAAGPAGVNYITLRCRWDRGAQWMPGAAQVLRDLPSRRHLAYTTEPIVVGLDGAPGVCITELRAQEAHIGGASCGLAAAAEIVAADAAGSAGQFWYLLAGSLVDATGRTHLADTCIYFAPDEEPSRWQAGPAGAQWLQLRFPLH
jgi:hypothetical protein